MNIGPYQLTSNAIAAPMAGVTDQPFRNLCREMGAGLAVSEMITSDVGLWNSQKTKDRLLHGGEQHPTSVQIAGTEPNQMADAARKNVDLGAQIIDINMGCPAKKVCKAAAGSALLRNETLVKSILRATVNAVQVPVTLKIRTGWDRENRNAISIAKIAEGEGIQAIAVHGRTRNDFINGHAEYKTIRDVKRNVDIPVIANGDICSPIKAQQVLQYTGADAIMIGRAAQGRPWIFREITHFLKKGVTLPPPSPTEIKLTLLKHLHSLYDFYGEGRAVRIARKHVGWYFSSSPDTNKFRKRFNQLQSAKSQTIAIAKYINEIENIREPVAA